MSHDSPPRPEKPMSLAAFAAEEGLTAMQRAGFEAHVRFGEGSNFNLRPRSEWARMLNTFRTVDRRRV